MDTSSLTQKWHGLAVYQWIAGGGLLLGAFVIYRRKRAGTGAASSSTVADNTPSAATNGAVDNTGGMPWSGGAPSDVGGINDMISQLQQGQSDNSAMYNDALNAAMQQETTDNLANQAAITNMAAENAKTNATNSAQFATMLSSTNAGVTDVVHTAPIPSPAKTPQAGIGSSKSSYLPPATVAVSAKNSKKSVVGKPGNSGVHAA